MNGGMQVPEIFVYQKKNHKKYILESLMNC